MEHRLGQDIIKKGVEGSLAAGTARGYEIRTNRVITHPDRLKRFNTKKPKVFAIWNDLYHNDVHIDFRDDVYTSMIVNQQNIYLILTKRPASMFEYICRHPRLEPAEIIYNHIWHGLTVCNQPELDEKWPIFAQVPGKKFLSIEPMLGPINLFRAFGTEGPRQTYIEQIDAVILGGETGPGARPLHPEWVRSVRDQCQSAGVPFFFKSWGARGMLNSIEADFKRYGRILDGRTHDELPWVKGE